MAKPKATLLERLQAGQKKAEKELDGLISAVYQKEAQGRTISIMRIPTLFSEVRAAFIGGTDLIEATRAAIGKHCEPLPMGTRTESGACSNCGASGFTYDHNAGGYPCMTCHTVKPSRPLGGDQPT